MPNNKLIYLARRNPDTSRGDWPKTWKSHAIFASQFAAARSRIEWMRYCNRIDAPMLNGAPVSLPMVSTAHDGVALINSGPNQHSLSPLPDDVRQALDTDELRVFDQYVKNFSLPCVETAVLEGLPGKAAVYVFLPAGDSTLRDRLDACHAEIVRRALPALTGVSRYAHNHPVQAQDPPFDFGAVIEMWFATPDDAARALKEGALQPVLDDLARFADMGRAVIMLTGPCHAYPKDEVLRARHAGRTNSRER